MVGSFKVKGCFKHEEFNVDLCLWFDDFGADKTVVYQNGVMVSQDGDL